MNRNSVLRPICHLLLAAGLGAAVPARAETAHPDFIVVSQTAALLTGLAANGAKTSELRLDKAPAAVIVSPDGTMAYVSQPELGRVSKVGLADFTLAGSVDVGGQPFGLALAGDGRLFVADWSSNRLAEYDAAGKLLRETTVGDAPSAVILSKDGQRAFTVDRESDALSIVDLATFTVEDTIDVGTAPFAAALAPDGRRLFVANVQSGDLSVIDLAFNQEIARIPIGGMPYGVAVSADGKTVAVTDQTGGRLVLVEARSLTIGGVVTVGEYAEGVAALGSGGFVVANWFSDTVSVVGPKGEKVDHIAVAAGPRMVAVLPSAPTNPAPPAAQE